MTTKDRSLSFRISALVEYLISFIFLLVCYIIYAYLPVNDEFTNSPDVPGSKAVGVFLISPVAAFISVLIFVAFVFLNRKYFYNLISSNNKIGKITIKPAVIEWSILIVSLALTVMLCICGVYAFLLYQKYNKLGFVAPIGDTYFMSYQKYILITTIVYFIFFILAVLRMFKFSWLDKLACLIISLADKNKKTN